MMTGFSIAPSANAVSGSGCTVPDRVATHLFPTIEGMVHRTGEVIPDRFSAEVLGPGARNEALAVQFMAVHPQGQRPAEAVQAALSTIHPLLDERARLFLQEEERRDPPAPPVGERQENNYRKSKRTLSLVTFFKKPG